MELEASLMRAVRFLVVGELPAFTIADTVMASGAEGLPLNLTEKGGEASLEGAHFPSTAGIE